MIFNICLFLISKIRNLANAKSAFHALILSLFLFGQIGATAHAHAHEHDDEPQHEACAFCILTVNDDEDLSDGLDLPDVADGADDISLSHWQCVNQLDALVAQHVSSIITPKRHGFNRYLDAARAPPIEG